MTDKRSVCEPNPEGGKNHVYCFCSCDVTALEQRVRELEQELSKYVKGGCSCSSCKDGDRVLHPKPEKGE